MLLTKVKLRVHVVEYQTQPQADSCNDVINKSYTAGTRGKLPNPTHGLTHATMLLTKVTVGTGGILYSTKSSTSYSRSNFSILQKSRISAMLTNNARALTKSTISNRR